MTTITTTFAAEVAALVAAGKNPWITVADDKVQGVYANRDQARAAKNGSPKKAADVDCTVVAEARNEDVQVERTPVAPVEQADASDFAAFKASEAATPEVEVKPVPPVAPEAPKAADKPKADILHASSVVRPTKLVWQICDDMKAANPSVTRKEILAECERRGIAFYTARTQYQVWKSMQ